MISRGEFMEHADVFGNYYGTARKSLTNAAAHGKDLLLDIDVQGAEQVRTRMPEAVSIFVLPPNPETLEARLRNRSRAEGLLDDAVIARRLAKARSEIRNYHHYGYVLLNDILDIAVDELSAIVAVERIERGAAPSGAPGGTGPAETTRRRLPSTGYAIAASAGTGNIQTGRLRQRSTRIMAALSGGSL